MNNRLSSFPNIFYSFGCSLFYNVHPKCSFTIHPKACEREINHDTKWPLKWEVYIFQVVYTPKRFKPCSLQQLYHPDINSATPAGAFFVLSCNYHWWLTLFLVRNLEPSSFSSVFSSSDWQGLLFVIDLICISIIILAFICHNFI